MKNRVIKDKWRRCTAVTEVEVGVFCWREGELGNQVLFVGTTRFEAWELDVVGA